MCEHCLGVCLSPPPLLVSSPALEYPTDNKKVPLTTRSKNPALPRKHVSPRSKQEISFPANLTMMTFPAARVGPAATARVVPRPRAGAIMARMRAGRRIPLQMMFAGVTVMPRRNVDGISPFFLSPLLVLFILFSKSSLSLNLNLTLAFLVISDMLIPPAKPALSTCKSSEALCPLSKFY